MYVYEKLGSSLSTVLTMEVSDVPMRAGAHLSLTVINRPV